MSLFKHALRWIGWIVGTVTWRSILSGSPKQSQIRKGTRRRRSRTAAQQGGGAAGRQAEIDDESAQRDKAEQRPAAIDVLDGEIASGIEHDLVDSAKRCAPADTRARAVSITART